VGDHEADHQSQRRHNLEIDDRFQADATDLPHVLHAGDAVHDSAEDDRSDHHLDRLDEHIAERLHPGAQRRIKISARDADRDCTQHLHIEVLIDLPLV
jgi:hypothetical protein